MAVLFQVTVLKLEENEEEPWTGKSWGRKWPNSSYGHSKKYYSWHRPKSAKQKPVKSIETPLKESKSTLASDPTKVKCLLKKNTSVLKMVTEFQIHPESHHFQDTNPNFHHKNYQGRVMIRFKKIKRWWPCGYQNFEVIRQGVHGFFSSHWGEDEHVEMNERKASALQK